MSILNSFKEPGYKTTNFNLSTQRTFATTPGVITPFYHRVTLPGDKFFVKVSQGVETLPLQSPLFSTFRSRVAWFWLSWRAVSPKLHYNSGTIDPREVQFPSFLPFGAPVEGTNTLRRTDGSVVDDVVAPQNLLNFLYYPAYFPFFDKAPLEVPTSNSDAYNEAVYRSGLPYYMYHSVFYHWYANWQEDVAYQVGDLNSADHPDGTGFPVISVSTETLRRYLLTIALHAGAPLNLATYQGPDGRFPKPVPSRVYGGLWLCTHTPDRLTAAISTATQQSIASSAQVSVSNGSFSIDSFISTERIKKYLEFGFFGASGYRDWVYAQTGVTPPADCGVPSCLAFSDLYVNFSTIVATSKDGLGELASRGQGVDRSPLRRFNFTEYGTLMACHTLVPLVSYAPSLEPETCIEALSDLPTPIMQNIAWQPLLRSERSMFPSLELVTDPANGTSLSATNLDPSTLLVVRGYQPAWSSYMTDVDRVYGELEPYGNLAHWTLNRPFSTTTTSESKNDVVTVDYSYNDSTYVFPGLYNAPFVDNSLSATNFFVRVNLDIRARRQLSKRAVPTLA